MRKQVSKDKFKSKYSALISTFIEAKRNKESNPVSLTFYPPTDLGNNKIPNLSIRMEHIKGQVEFFALKEDKTFLSLDEFDKKEYFNENLFYWFCRNRRDRRYYLTDLIKDLIKINNHTKLVYVILFSPKYTDVMIFTLDLLLSADIEGSSHIDFTEDRKDSLDQYHEYMRQVNNPCPACGNEWNGDYCYFCGHPH